MRVRLIERKKIGNKWTIVSVPLPKLKPNKKVYLRDDREGKFLLVWVEAKKKRYSETFAHLSDALRALELKQSYLDAIEKGIVANDPMDEPEKLTVGSGIDEFLKNLTGRGNTVSLYTHALRQFEGWNDKQRNRKKLLEQIDRPHIMAFKRFLEQEIGNDEFTAAWKCLRLNKCIKDMLGLGAGKGPVAKRDFSEVLNRKPVVVTYGKEEIEKFLATCSGRSKVIFTLLFKCGLRSKECTHLEWDDLELKRRVLHIRHKKKMMDGDKEVEFRPKKWSVRDVALPLDLAEELKKMEAGKTCNLVFPTWNNRVDIRLWDKCKRIAEKAGVDAKKFMPKNFRSSHATNRLRNGYTLAELRDGLGHRDLHSIEHYLAAMQPEELVRTGRVDAGW